MSDMTEFEAKCLDAMADYGLTPDTLLLDGKYHRFPGAEKGRRDKAAGRCAEEDQRPAAGATAPASAGAASGKTGGLSSGFRPPMPPAEVFWAK